MTSLELAPPVVETSVVPDGAALVAARQYLATSGEARQAFQRVLEGAEGQGWLEDRLGTLLMHHWGDAQAEQAQDCGTYLAAEWAQLKRPVMVDPETGLAIKVLSEDDFYIPAPVLRETGNVVQREPDVRPEVKAGVALYLYREAQDKERLAQYAGKTPTELLRQEGDTRLAMLSYQGRKALGEQVLASDPQELLNACTGKLRACCKALSEGPVPPEWCTHEASIQASLSVNIADTRAFNIQAGGQQVLLATLGNTLMLEALKTLATLARHTGAATPLDLDGAILACHPNLRRQYPQAVLFSTPSLLIVPAGTATLYDWQVVDTRRYELSDKWTLEYRVKVKLAWSRQVYSEPLDLIEDAVAV